VSTGIYGVLTSLSWITHVSNFAKFSYLIQFLICMWDVSKARLPKSLGKKILNIQVWFYFSFISNLNHLLYVSKF